MTPQSTAIAEPSKRLAVDIRDAIDSALLTDPAFRQREAEGIAAGIARYLGGN